MIFKMADQIFLTAYVIMSLSCLFDISIIITAVSLSPYSGFMVKKFKLIRRFIS